MEESDLGASSNESAKSVRMTMIWAMLRSVPAGSMAACAELRFLPVVSFPKWQNVSFWTYVDIIEEAMVSGDVVSSFDTPTMLIQK
jgi:hypothetical protein